MIQHLPFFFGGAHHLFGLFTRGAPSRTRDCAVLLCPPLGHEYVCSYRTFGRLATRLAEAGFPVLRFDYFGTGNSAGTATDPGLVNAWRESVSIAVDELRNSSGCQRVAVVGLRFGATLAATVAAERGDIATAVLWNPCATGKTYMREVRMLGITNPEQSTAPCIEAGSVEAAGFHFSAETVSALSTTDLTRLDRKPAGRMLLLTRDDLPASGNLADHLRAHGAACEEQRAPGYAKFMVSPVHSEAPEAAVEQLAAWMDRSHPELVDASCLVGGFGPASALPLPLPGHAVREQAVTFGNSLVGIFTAPISKPSTDLPAVLLLNTGADHHIGPHRLYVPVSRDWAARGFTVLRFDIGGIGESPERPGVRENEAYPPNALDDVQAAISYLRETRGFDRIILAGICSGAFHAIHASASSVAGVIAVNPPLYWEPGRNISSDPYANGYEVRRVWRAVWVPAKWLRLATGKVDLEYTARVFGKRARDAARAATTFARRKAGEDRQSASRELETLLSNATAVDMIFSDGDPALTHLQQTLGARFSELAERGNFKVEVVTGAGHTFMPVGWHASLAKLLTARLMERYHPHGASVEPAAASQ
ncbi:MAG: alpha/beta fold hydrolase [Gemmatimonadaceae bacterium]